jgi:ribosome-associated translation inhibitor RaiA
MQILVNSDHNIIASESVTERVESIVSAAVERFSARITRVEVHLSDMNGPKHGEREKRCALEARVAGVGPVAVAHEAPSLVEAIEAAADKLERALEHTLGRLDSTARPSPREADIATVEELQALEAGDRR